MRSNQNSFSFLSDHFIPHGCPRPPCYTPCSGIPAEIPVDIPADSDQSLPCPPIALIRPIPMNPLPTVLLFCFYILFLEQPHLHFYILFHLCDTLTINIRVYVYCAFVLISRFLLYQIYLLFCTYSLLKLLLFSPFLIVLIAIPLHIVVHRPVPSPTPTNNHPRHWYFYIWFLQIQEKWSPKVLQ